MVPFTHDVKIIKGVGHKNGDIDATCIQAFTFYNLISIVKRLRAHLLSFESID